MYLCLILTCIVLKFAIKHLYTQYNIHVCEFDNLFLARVHVLYVTVVVLCASADSVREIMIKAHELNFDNGEYVFLNIDLFSR